MLKSRSTSTRRNQSSIVFWRTSRFHIGRHSKPSKQKGLGIAVKYRRLTNSDRATGWKTIPSPVQTVNCLIRFVFLKLCKDLIVTLHLLHLSHDSVRNEVELQGVKEKNILHTAGPLACWDRGFESHRGHGYLSVVSVVCCQVEVCTTSWSLVQRSPTDCAASLCVI